MTATLDLHAAPGAGFDQPFDMLIACHQRVERMLDLLERLARHIEAKGCDGEAGQAARDVMRYFDLAGPAHHEDEERHVFAALLAGGDAATCALVKRLQEEHRAMSRQWGAVRVDLQRIVAGDGSVGPASEAPARWAAFALLYRSHIAIEEAQAYPAAQPMLDAAARAAMGREMAERRGARPPAP